MLLFFRISITTMFRSAFRRIIKTVHSNTALQTRRYISVTTLLPNKIKEWENRDTIAEENWVRRCELATAYRAFEKYNMHEGVCNHLSVKTPSLYRQDPIVLLIPYGMYWSEVTPQCLVGIDMNTAETVEDGEGAPDLVAHSIHRGIYRHRTDVNAVMHSHARYSTALSVLEDPTIQQLHQNSARFYNNVAYDIGYEGVPMDGHNTEADRIAKVIGNKEVLVMGNHGLATVGESVAVAFDLHYYFEKAAEVQVLAYQTKKPIRLMNQNAVEQVYNVSVLYKRLYAEAHFYGIQDALKREDPTFLRHV